MARPDVCSEVTDRSSRLAAVRAAVLVDELVDECVAWQATTGVISIRLGVC